MSEPTTQRSPWTFVPLLYFMQAIPVALVQEVATICYKDFGIANEPIVRWTSLIALPWSLQMLLGPLVDLNGTKRRWILGGQLAMAIGLIVAPLLLHLPQAFELSLATFFFVAVFSALCNAATDGFYLLAMPKEKQAAFAGVQTTCYRLGRLFCTGVLVLIVGRLSAIPSLQFEVTGGGLSFKSSTGEIVSQSKGRLEVHEGFLANETGARLDPPVEIATTTSAFVVWPDGGITTFPGKTDHGQRLSLNARVSSETRGGCAGLIKDWDAGPMAGCAEAPMTKPTAWSLALLVAAALFGLGYLINNVTVPRPADDHAAAEQEPGENRRNITRTLTVVLFSFCGYFAVSAIWKLIAHGAYLLTGKPGWKLGDDPMYGPFHANMSGPVAEVVQFVVCAIIAGWAWSAARRSIVGTPMGEAFSTYFAQPKIFAILSFLMFYRFGEVMVAKMSPLFLKDSLANGGMAIANDQLGLIKGLVGVLGIVCGGILGGLFIARLGLRRSFWPLVITMHTPNLLYLFASIAHPPVEAVYGIEFVDQFGYGFGYAGYMIFLMQVAKRGAFPTAHYALGVGIGALFISLAGIVGGVIQSSFGYPAFFTSVIFFTIPGMLTLRYIPLDAEPAKP